MKLASMKYMPEKNNLKTYCFNIYNVSFSVEAENEDEAVRLANEQMKKEDWSIDLDPGDDSHFTWLEMFFPFEVTVDDIVERDRLRPEDAQSISYLAHRGDDEWEIAAQIIIAEYRNKPV